MKRIDTDILIVGTGAAGLFAALHADPDKKFNDHKSCKGQERFLFSTRWNMCFKR